MDDNIFMLDKAWSEKYPKAKAGILVMKNVDNFAPNEKLDGAREEVEKELRGKFNGFSREQLNALPVIESYNRYYKNFGGKTYHVRSQVESVLNGKSLVSSSPAVTAMFMAEVKNMLLTAGHDMTYVKLPIHITAATGNETFTDIRGEVKNIPTGDMTMADEQGTISSVILGPDKRTKLTQDSSDMIFAVYATAEINSEVVLSHLKDIERYVLAFSPEAATESMEVFMA